MPLHRWFVPPNLYSDEDKAAIAKAITSRYSMLPPFYVVVLFIDVKENSYFVGGEKNNQFVRIGIEHIARHFPDDVTKRAFMDKYEESIAPFTKGRGIDWEIQISECDRILWNENGMSPPMPNTEGEKLWKEKNKAVPYERQRSNI